MPKRIAFATYEKLPELTPDDQLAVAALGTHGVEAVPAVWDDAEMDWAAFDGVILRSTWDYHLKVDRFGEWLETLETLNTPLWNPPDIVRWNIDKLYLSDLQEMGFAVTPSVWLPRGARVQLTEVLETKGWAEAVVKPTVSASAHRTQRISLASANGAQAEVEDMLKASGVVVQPFLDEVQTQGEWSLMFFGKQFCHGVLKRPKGGDFRVQAHFGCSEEVLQPPEALIGQAAEILDQVNDPVVYARVDGVEQDGQFVLMELELIEPVLFLGHAKGAAERFTKVLKELL
jgi:glutathione synthase/RimK-type ligase-like ATP-grasp enzyme